MRLLFSLMVLVLGMLVCAPVQAQFQAQGQLPEITLKLGDPAPALKTGKWIKGEPVTKFEKGKVYVIDFWGTWCVPCIMLIPHTTELASKNPDVVFIGQSVWERDQNAVEPFVNDAGDKIGYRIVLDDVSKDPMGEVARTWLLAAGETGVPTVYVVDQQSRIAWMGHPIELEPVLKQIKEGTYDLEKAKAQAVLLTKLNEAIQAQDVDKALKVTDEMLAASPQSPARVHLLRFRLQTIKGDFDAANKIASTLPDLLKDTPSELADVAWMIATDDRNPKPDMALAEKIATTASNLTENKDANILDTLATVYAKKGNLDKAIETQRKALAVAEDQAMKEAMQRNLNRLLSDKAATQPAN